MEGRQGRVDVFGLAGCVREGAFGVDFGCCVRVRVDCLPDGEEPVDVCVVQPEDWIKACVWDVAHVSSVADQAVDSVVHVLEGVVGPASAIDVSGVRERCVVGLVRDQLVSRVVDGLRIGLELRVG